MDTKLDVVKVIDTATFAIEDPKKSFAATVEYFVQDLVIAGREYRISIKLTQMDDVRTQAAQMKPYLGND